MSDTPQLLLVHHLKALKLPTFLREYDKLAQQCAAEGVDHPRYLLRLAELELIDRERRVVERRIKEARFPTVKSLDSFDFTAIPSLNKALVLELARCEYIARRENVIAVGNSGTGKSHIALGLGLAVCQKGLSVGFTTAAAMVHELIEARDEKRLLRLQRQLAGYKLLIIDELGYVPLSTTGAELLFEVFSQRYERGSTLVTSNLPFDEWTDRHAARPADPPRPHPRIERRELSAQTEQATPPPDVKPGWRAACHGAHCGEGPGLAMLALLRVAPLLPSPTLRAVARGLPGRDGKAGSSIEPES
jgi:DNA replication protein DnaC